MKYYGYTHEGITYWIGPMTYDTMRRNYDIFSKEVEDTYEGIRNRCGVHTFIDDAKANYLMDLYYRG